MTISDIDQDVSCFHWFAVDSNNYLVHFSSDGGRLPNSVAASRENLDLLDNYFFGLPILFTPAEIYIAPTKAPFPYLEYALRGLFYYEGDEDIWPLGTTYKLAARPPRALILADLPIEIAALVSRTQLGISVIELESLDTKEVA